MGIDLYCGDKTFGCSHNVWRNVRKTLIESTFEYLVEHFDVSNYKEDTNEYGSMIALKHYIKRIENVVVGKQFDLLDNFYVYSKHLEFVDLLIQFGVGGIYTLCNKSENEGFYSVGNSYDICDLIKIVKPFLLKNKKNIDAEENWLYNGIDNITNIFEESIKKNRIVIIC